MPGVPGRVPELEQEPGPILRGHTANTRDGVTAGSGTGRLSYSGGSAGPAILLAVGRRASIRATWTPTPSRIPQGSARFPPPARFSDIQGPSCRQLADHPTAAPPVRAWGRDLSIAAASSAG